MLSIFDSISDSGFTIQTYIICLVAAFLCGILAAFSASYGTRVTKSFIISLVLLPPIVATVITMVNGNIGTGVAVMGAFSLVRFRSVPGKAKDIASIFMAMTAGLACASGYVGIALLFSVILCIAMLLLSKMPLGEEKTMNLNVTIPESLRFTDEFDDLFKEYTKRHYLVKAKTTNMGSLYKLSYKIELKDANRQQEFLDAIRCRNGNLEVALSAALEGSDEL